MNYNVDVDNELRPQSTSYYKKDYQSRSFDFPNIYPTGPIVIMDTEPVSTRATIQNALLQQRYFNK